MSSFIAKVKKIQKCDSLHLLTLESSKIEITLVTLELSSDIKVDKEVRILYKPTHVTVAKDFSGSFSDENQLPCTVKSVENGELLSSIELDFFGTRLDSIITKASSQKMSLTQDEQVTAFINPSELSLEAL